MFKASSNLIKWFLEALSVKSPPAKILLAFKESNKKERRIRRKTSLSLVWTQYTVCAITHIYTKPWNSRIQSNISYKPHSWYLPKHLFLFKQRNKNNFQEQERNDAKNQLPCLNSYHPFQIALQFSSFYLRRDHLSEKQES